MVIIVTALQQHIIMIFANRIYIENDTNMYTLCCKYCLSHLCQNQLFFSQIQSHQSSQQSAVVTDEIRSYFF